MYKIIHFNMFNMRGLLSPHPPMAALSECCLPFALLFIRLVFLLLLWLGRRCKLLRHLLGDQLGHWAGLPGAGREQCMLGKAQRAAYGTEMQKGT